MFCLAYFVGALHRSMSRPCSSKRHKGHPFEGLEFGVKTTMVCTPPTLAGIGSRVIVVVGVVLDLRISQGDLSASQTF